MIIPEIPITNAEQTRLIRLALVLGVAASILSIFAMHSTIRLNKMHMEKLQDEKKNGSAKTT